MDGDLTAQTPGDGDSDVRRAAGSGAFVAVACVACCAPPLIAALGLTAGLAAVIGVFLGLAAAVAVVLLGAGWIAARRRQRRVASCSPPEPVPVVMTTRRSP